jgi:MATE family multidrug resistance protein
VSLGRSAGDPDAHPFLRHPHRTFAALSWPVLLSLIAEPIAGVADTAFIARLGPAELAGLGVATTLLSGVFWVFGFLGIGAQTEVARALGAGNPERARETSGLVFFLSLGIGVVVAVATLPVIGGAARALGAHSAIEEAAHVYLRIRLIGLPGSLLMAASFGVLRGQLDMRTPLWVAATVSLLNIVLDPILIFGVGPVPPLGVAGAAWATTGTQWLGGVWAAVEVSRRLGMSRRLRLVDVTGLLKVGRDLFLRTGLLLAFLFLATRTATRAGANPGAAHQALRQIWLLTALLLDAYAATAQSLVGYFIGAARVALARHVAGIACIWALATGFALAAAMLLLEEPVARLLVPPSARATFAAAWWIAAAAQPINALSFVTDGIHWGTADFRYLRNGMFLATGIGAGLLLVIDTTAPEALALVWTVTALWAGVRSAVGLLRIWPAPGRSPLRI